MIKIDSREIEVIDAHVHPPRVPSPGKTRENMIDDFVRILDEAGVDRAVLLSIETNKEDFNKYMRDIDPEEAKSYFWYFWRVVPIEEKNIAKRYLFHLGKQIHSLVNTPEEEVKDFLDRYPNRIVGFGSINPNKDEEYIRNKFKKIKDYGFKGIKLLPNYQFFNPKDEKMSLIYECAEKEELIILIHMGLGMGPWELPSLSKDCSPSHLGDIAAQHPDLKIVLAHMGGYFPYLPPNHFENTLNLLKRNDNIYMDISASFNEDLLKKVLNEVGSDRILYGSDYPAITGFCDRFTGMKNCIRWVLSLEIDLESKENILGKNARDIGI